MSEAIAKSQRQLPEQMAARSLSYRQLMPFDWKSAGREAGNNRYLAGQTILSIAAW